MQAQTQQRSTETTCDIDNCEAVAEWGLWFRDDGSRPRCIEIPPGGIEHDCVTQGCDGCARCVYPWVRAKIPFSCDEHRSTVEQCFDGEIVSIETKISTSIQPTREHLQALYKLNRLAKHYRGFAEDACRHNFDGVAEWSFERKDALYRLKEDVLAELVNRHPESIVRHELHNVKFSSGLRTMHYLVFEDEESGTWKFHVDSSAVDLPEEEASCTANWSGGKNSPEKPRGIGDELDRLCALGFDVNDYVSIDVVETADGKRHVGWELYGLRKMWDLKRRRALEDDE